MHPLILSTNRPVGNRLLGGAHGFSLVEMMFALAILTVGSGILYQSLRANFTLAAKNTSMNTSNSGMQRSYYSLLSTLEGAAMFVDCATYNSTTQTFSAVSNGTWANSVRFMRLLPMTVYILPMDNSGYSVTNPPPPTRAVYYPASYNGIYMSFNMNIYNSNSVPSSARFYLSYPTASETVSGGSSPGVKPGLGIASIDYSNAAAFNGLTVLYTKNPIPANTVLDCNRAYFIVESAFAVTTDPTDGHKTLLYFSDTSQTANPVVVCRLLDSGNQTQPNDATIPSGGTQGTFCLAAAGNTVQVLLPVRDIEFSNVMSRSGGAASRNNAWININTKFRQRQNF